MSVKASPFKVGAFVLAGLVLGVVVLLVFGSGRLFRHNVPFILHFQNAVQGLSVGAPVKFRGVEIGRVKSIRLALESGSLTTHVPVVIEVDTDLIRDVSGKDVDVTDKSFLEGQFNSGLRASLESESLITGRLYVQLDYHPGSAAPVFVDQEHRYPEIPTISTGLAEFIHSLGRLDIPGLADKVTLLVNQLSTTVSELKLKELSDQLAHTLRSVDELVASTDLKGTLGSFKLTSDEARTLVTELRGEIKPVAGGITNTAARAEVALTDLQQTLEQVRNLVARDSPVISQLDETLAEFADAARSVRLLAEQLRRNPNSIIFGAKPSEPEPAR